METIVNMQYVINALVFSGIGLVILAFGFILFDAMTPKVSIWKELVEKQNIAMGIFVGSLMIGIALIVSSAIHG